MEIAEIQMQECLILQTFVACEEDGEVMALEGPP